MGWSATVAAVGVLGLWNDVNQRGGSVEVGMADTFGVDVKIIDDGDSLARRLGVSVNKLGKTVLAIPGGGSTSASATENKPKPASLAQMTAATKVLKAGGVNHCPSGKYEDFKVPIKGDGDDPSAVLCLLTDSAAVTTIKGKSAVRLEMAINPAYEGAPFASLAKTFDSLSIKQCTQTVAPLVKYGEALLADTGKIPAGFTAPVSLRVDGATAPTCTALGPTS